MLVRVVMRSGRGLLVHRDGLHDVPPSSHIYLEYCSGLSRQPLPNLFGFIFCLVARITGIKVFHRGN